MATQNRVGKSRVEVEGIRHLGDHESVVYVRHIYGDADDNVAKAVQKKKKQPVKCTSQRHVMFSGEDATSESPVSSDSSDGEIKDNFNNNNTSHSPKVKDKLSKVKSSVKPKTISHKDTKKVTQQVSSGKVKEEKKTKEIITASSLELYGVSPRLARRHQMMSQQHTAPGITVDGQKHHLPQSVVSSSVERLGLSPGLHRKVLTGQKKPLHGTTTKRRVLQSAKSPSTDNFSYSPNNSSSEPSPMQSPNLRDARKMSIPPVPLHSNFIGSEGELEKLKFIKKALTHTPSLPEILQKLSHSPNQYLKPPVASTGRRRSVSMDPMDFKLMQAREAVKKRIDSAHH